MDDDSIFTDAEKEAFKEWASAQPVWCVNCGSDNVEYQKTLCHSHSDEDPRIHISLYCLDCGKIATGKGKPFISRDKFTDEQIAAMPVRVDNRDETHVCCVRGCDRTGVELNHFAPRHLFGAEADDWPVGWLCTPHHREWHQKTETGAYWRGRNNNGVTNG